MLRALALFGFASLNAFAQLQLAQFDGTVETPVGSTYQIPPAASGDTIETRFHVRNAGTGPAVLQALTLAGQGFKISAAPSVPYTIAAGNFTEFKVQFSPTGLGSYSANLQVNSSTVLLRGSAINAAVISLGADQLTAGQMIDFGGVLRGSSVTRSFTLANQAATVLTVSSVSVSGSGFSGPIGITTPLTLSPNQTVSFDVVFNPQTAGGTTAQLSVDQRVFNLAGRGLDPPLPTASIVLENPNPTSAMQTSVSVKLDSPSAVAGTGTLTMEFHPSVATAADDPAIQFLAGPHRVATITINPGDSVAHFGSASALGFQTGTTAGSITFTLQLPNSTQRTTLSIPPTQVALSIANGTRRVNELDVSLTGFDNTYSASQMAFTFYSTSGQTITTIQSDQTANFKTLFQSSQAGGAFALLATFPVSGDPTTIAGVEVEITNTAGKIRTQRITF